MIRIMLVDDHAVVREGYRRLLALEPDLQVVAECAEADSTYEWLQRHQDQHGLAIDVLVLDLSMPGRSGLDLLRRISLRWPRLRVLVFSMHDHPAMVSQALKGGATGFITKSSPPDELVAALRLVARGQTVLSADLVEAEPTAALPAQVSRPAVGDAPPHLHLSGREFDVLRYLLDGLSVEQIAARLSLSSKTISNYQTTIRQKLGVGNAVELLRYAQLHRLL